MIAFHLFGWPVYWYGIFYGITFLTGYLFLEWVGKKRIFASYTSLQALLTSHLDTVVVLVIGGILVGGRLGHVFLYDRGYYSSHFTEIFQVRQGGMSFVGGVIGVVAVLVFIRKRYKLSCREFMLLGDLVLCIVPLGIFLGRIGNYLNKELYGLPIDQSSHRFDLLVHRGLAVDYKIDTPPTFRLNTNIIQSLGEGLLTGLIGQALFRRQRIRGYFRPGLISAWFFVVYGLVRFGAEYLKELPASEMYGWLSISQRLMIGFFGFGIALLTYNEK